MTEEVKHFRKNLINKGYKKIWYSTNEVSVFNLKIGDFIVSDHLTENDMGDMITEVIKINEPIKKGYYTVKIIIGKSTHQHSGKIWDLSYMNADYRKVIHT